MPYERIVEVPVETVIEIPIERVVEVPQYVDRVVERKVEVRDKEKLTIFRLSSKK